MRVWDKKHCVEVEVITMEPRERGYFFLYCMDDNAKCYVVTSTEVCSLKEHERMKNAPIRYDERDENKLRSVWDCLER